MKLLLIYDIFSIEMLNLFCVSEHVDIFPLKSLGLDILTDLENRESISWLFSL